MAEGDIVPADDQTCGIEFPPHQLSRSALDDLATGYAQPEVVRQLRRAERSRRLLLLRALDEKLMKSPDLVGPLTEPDEVWELLARAEQVAPEARELLLAHPYTGAWAGYVTRLLRDKITGVCPLWVHVGYLHTLAAAVAIRARISFTIRIPVWDGGAMLPTLGMARLDAHEPHSVAVVRGNRHAVEVANARTTVRLPRGHAEETDRWWGIRTVNVRAGDAELSLRLDDLDAHRGLYEPVPPQRLTQAGVVDWQRMLEGAWQLLRDCLPDLAAGIPAVLDSLVPRPAAPLRNLSASTGEAFGSVIVAKPADVTSLAATLVHEFHHNLLGGVLHMFPLYEHDPHERFYTLWRDDPRPISGTLSGIHAFFGVTAFWRALRQRVSGQAARRAGFEFGYWRVGTWRTLRALSGDPHLTEAGQRSLDGIAERLRPWLDEPLPVDVAAMAVAAAADHLGGWRIRYLRPLSTTVQTYTEAWLAGQEWPSGVEPDSQLIPTPVPDGSWSGARTNLARAWLVASAPSPQAWSIPDATGADIAYVSGDIVGAIQAYRRELRSDADQPESWIGLGLALSAQEPGATSARALLQCPELVRAVHRAVQHQTGTSPEPDELASWIGRSVC